MKTNKNVAPSPRKGMTNLHLSNQKSSDFFPSFLQNYCICFKVLNYDAEYALVFQTAHTPQIVIAEGGELHAQTQHTPQS